MDCASWTEKLDAHLDGELAKDQSQALEEHLRSCSTCASEALRRLQWKRTVQSAGRRFTPDARFRLRVRDVISPRRTPPRIWRWLPAAAAALALLIAAAVLIPLTQRQHQEQVLGEIADLHVATLASSNPVDVVSEDRHTVKPWFQGRIPFTFDLPELKDTQFTLVGGRVAYLEEAPGAELVFQIRKHRISVFIFPESTLPRMPGLEDQLVSRRSFRVQTWARGGLRYFVISDAGADDVRALSSLLAKSQGP